MSIRRQRASHGKNVVRLHGLQSKALGIHRFLDLVPGNSAFYLYALLFSIHGAHAAELPHVQNHRPIHKGVPAQVMPGAHHADRYILSLRALQNVSNVLDGSRRFNHAHNRRINASRVGNMQVGGSLENLGNRLA